MRITITADGANNCRYNADGIYRNCIHLAEVTVLSKYRNASSRAIPVTWTMASATTDQPAGKTSLLSLTDKDTTTSYHSGYSVGTIRLVGVMATDDLHTITITPVKGSEVERRGLLVKVELLNHKVSNEFDGGTKCVDYTKGIGQYGYGYGRMCAYYDYANDALYYAPHYSTNECIVDSDCPTSLSTQYPYLQYVNNNPVHVNGPFYNLMSNQATSWCKSMDTSTNGWEYYFYRYLCSQAMPVTRYSNQWSNFPVIPGTNRMHVQYDGSLTHAVPIYQYQYDNKGSQIPVPFVSEKRQILANEA